MLPPEIEIYSASQPANTAGFSTLHSDIIATHILTRLDGPSLVSIASSSTSLRRDSSPESLWSNICHSTWPSTTHPRVSHILSEFPNGGPRSFFSHAFPLPFNHSRSSSSTQTSELISAVDIYYKDELILSKIQETETSTGWFLCSPFRIDLLEPKDVVPTPIKHPQAVDTCREIIREMKLSWIMIDPIGKKAVNLSSQEPVWVQRHWLTGEVQAQFTSILPTENGYVQCGVVVTCGESEGTGEMQVREVRVEMEDMDGKHLNGKDSLVILQGAMEGRKGNGRSRVDESQRRYKEYIEMKRERRERNLRREGVLDNLCVTVGILIVVSFCCFFLAG